MQDKSEICLFAEPAYEIVFLVSKPQEAVLTDQDLAQTFLKTYDQVMKAAIAAVHTEGMPSENVAIVRFSGETHDLSVWVRERDMAVRGITEVLPWLRRGSVSARVHLAAPDDPDGPTNKLSLFGARRGRTIVEPRILGSTLLPRQFPLHAPLGMVRGNIHTFSLQDQHPRTYQAFTDPAELRTVVQTFINMRPRKLKRTVESVGEAELDNLFNGAERRQLRAITDGFVQQSVDRHNPALFEPVKAHIGHTYPTLHLSNELTEPEGDCAVRVAVNVGDLIVDIIPAPTGKWANLPPLRLAGTSISYSFNPQTLTILDQHNRALVLSRADRQQILSLLQEKLHPELFEHAPSKREALLPEAAVLAACDRLVETAEIDKERVYRIPQSKDNEAQMYRFGIRRDHDGGYTCTLEVPDDKTIDPIVLSFSATRVGGFQLAKPLAPKMVLDLYDFIQRLARQAPPQ